MERQYLFTGGYHEKKSGGISCYEWKNKEGSLALCSVDTACRNPSFLAFHPKGDFVYAANELDHTARITAHRFDRETGRVTFLNAQETEGGGMCHLLLGKEGSAVYGANYNTGNLIAFRVKEDGSLGEVLSNCAHSGSSVHQRQEGPHMHQVVFSPLDERLIAVDFGTDALYSYKLFPDGSIDAASAVRSALPAGEGPRHLVFDKSGSIAYVLTELTCHLLVCDYEAETGRFVLRQNVSLVPAETFGEDVTGAELVGSADGAFLYASIRGLDQIITISTGADHKTLEVTGRQQSFGKMPRMFSMDPDETHFFIANQESGEVVVAAKETDKAVKRTSVIVPKVSFAALI